jgi:hypothetical protein
MSKDEEYHVKIRDHVLAEARRLAREAWPIASDYVIDRLATRGIQSALLQSDPIGQRETPSGSVTR